ncbi:MAG: hypothetical protein H3Z52_10350 [archaeon]|nr:hypothetical protein [archaeon]
MSESDKIDFKVLDYKCVGSDTVVFNLEDGAIVKVKVDIDKVGVATNYTNPDGTPHYIINASLKLNVIPASKKFSVPRSQIKAPPMPPTRPPDHVA